MQDLRRVRGRAARGSIAYSGLYLLLGFLAWPTSAVPNADKLSESADFLAQLVESAGGKHNLAQLQVAQGSAEVMLTVGAEGVPIPFLVGFYRREELLRYEIEYPGVGVWVLIHRDGQLFEYLKAPWYARFAAFLVGSRDGPMQAFGKRKIEPLEIWRVYSILLDTRSHSISIARTGTSQTGILANIVLVSEVGSTRELYFDVQSNLCVEERIIREGGSDTVLTYSDYREVDRVLLPFSVTIRDSLTVWQYQFTEISLGADIDDDLFVPPYVWPLWVVPLTIVIGIFGVIWVLWALRFRVRGRA